MAASSVEPQPGNLQPSCAEEQHWSCGCAAPSEPHAEHCLVLTSQPSTLMGCDWGGEISYHWFPQSFSTYRKVLIYVERICLHIQLSYLQFFFFFLSFSFCSLNPVADNSLISFLREFIILAQCLRPVQTHLFFYKCLSFISDVTVNMPLF